MQYFLNRLALIIPKILILLIICFLLIEMSPQSRIQADMEQGFALLRLSEFLQDVLLRFDFGTSINMPRVEISDLLRSGLSITVLQGVAASILMLILGVPMGVIAAVKRRSWIDKMVSFLALFANIIPNFVLAPLLVFMFVITLKWLPSHGFDGGSIHYLILPMITLGVAFLADVARMTRASMIEVLGASYIKGARARGLSMSQVVVHHALMPALLPVWAHLAPIFVYLLTGTVFVDIYFSTGGLGISLADSAINLDYPLMIGLAFIYGVLTIFANIFLDLIYVVVDPKLKETLL